MHKHLLTHAQTHRVCWWESQGSPWQADADNDKNSPFVTTINSNKDTQKHSYLSYMRGCCCVFRNQNSALTASTCFPVRKTCSLPLATPSLRRPYPWPRRSERFCPKLSVSLVPSRLPPGSCVNTPRPPALNKPSTQAIVYRRATSPTGRLSWRLHKRWQRVPERHWFSFRSIRRDLHGKRCSRCAVACISALFVVGQNKPGQMVSGAVGNIRVLSVCSMDHGGGPSCHSYLNSKWTNLIPVQQKCPSPPSLFQTLSDDLVKLPSFAQFVW